MTSSDDVTKSMLRNMLLGRWAAARLGMTSAEADAYANGLATDALDPERCDVFTRIRRDFDATGVVETDERILEIMSELMLKAGSRLTAREGSFRDKAALLLARNLMSP